MRFVSPALKHFVFPGLSRSGYLRHFAGDGPAVVTYHGVFPNGYAVRNAALDGNVVRADSMRRQLALLKNRYHVITPDDFLRWSQGEASVPTHSILLTCDDALRNTMSEMVPILLEQGLFCLFFATGASADETPSMLWYEELYLMLLDAEQAVHLDVPEAGIRVTGFLPSERHTSWWNLVGRLSQFDKELRSNLLEQIRDQLKLAVNWRARFVEDETIAARFLVLDRAGLQQLSNAGMTVGAHSLSHPILARMPENLAWNEISESRTVLEKALGQNVWAFGYPFGDAATVTGRELRLAEQAGFHCAFMNVGGGFGAKASRFAWPRVHVTADMSLAEFEAHVSGFYRLLRKRLLGGDEMDALAGV